MRTFLLSAVASMLVASGFVVTPARAQEVPNQPPAQMQNMPNMMAMMAMMSQMAQMMTLCNNMMTGMMKSDGSAAPVPQAPANPQRQPG